MKQIQFFLLICLIFFIFTGVSEAENLDKQIFDLINQDLKSPYLDKPLLGLSYFGGEIGQGILVGGFYLSGEKDTAILLTSALAKSFWTTTTIKHLVGRPRPGVTYDDVNFVDDYIRTDNESFPSGHTTGAFAVATVLSEQYPDYTPYFYTYATLMGVSRVYTGVHYPSDVLAGAALGYLIGKSTVKYKNLIVNGNFIEYTIKF